MVLMRVGDEDAVTGCRQIQRSRQQVLCALWRVEWTTHIEDDPVAPLFRDLNAIPANLMGRAVYGEANVHASVHRDDFQLGPFDDAVGAKMDVRPGRIGIPAVLDRLIHD